MDGIVLCAALTVPPLWSDTGTTNCLFLQDLTLVQNQDLKFSSNSADGGGGCGNTFGLTQYFSLTINSLAFDYSKGAAAPDFSLQATITQNQILPGMKNLLIQSASGSVDSNSKGVVIAATVTPKAATINFGTTANLNLYQANFSLDARTNPHYSTLQLTGDGSVGLSVNHVNLGWYQDDIGVALYIPRDQTPLNVTCGKKAAADVPETQLKYCGLPGHPDWFETLGTDIPAIGGIFVGTHFRIGSVTF
jgi:hypothetical protein